MNIWFKDDNLVWYNAVHFGSNVLSDFQSVGKQISQDLINSQIDLKSVSGKKLVVSFIGEGHCPEVIDNLITHLKTWPVVDMLIVFNSQTNINVLPYRAVIYTESMINHCGWFDRIKSVDPLLQVDCKFLCLMRRPSTSRAHLANRLLYSISSLKLSFGSMTESVFLSEYADILSGHKLPILLDGMVQRGSNSTEHDQTNPIFRNCLFNIVVESSSQTDSGVWRSQFITEKTFKAFGMRQIPIWMAVPELVSHVRAMGFDLFDDIIDHSYDNIVDEDQRQQKIVEQIIQLDQKYNLDECQQLRNQLEQRLENNYQLLINQSINGSHAFHAAIQEFAQSNTQQLLIFGDSWPHGDELQNNETPYGELLGQKLGITNIKNYSVPGTGISHTILQLQNALKHVDPHTKKIAVFFLSGQERFMCYHDNKIVNLSSRGPRINPENDPDVMHQLNNLYYRHFYTDQMRDFFMNTTLLTLQSMCRYHNIDDYYLAGWQEFNFWTEIDSSKIYNQGRTSCRDLLDMVFDNRDGVVHNNPYFTPNLSHPNQLGHQKIADTLFEWIQSK